MMEKCIKCESTDLSIESRKVNEVVTKELLNESNKPIVVTSVVGDFFNIPVRSVCRNCGHTEETSDEDYLQVCEEILFNL